jgi:hypothetical protein
LNPASCRPARSNRPIASNRKENHQRKYPIVRSDLLGQLKTYQCALAMKAVAAAHADARHIERDPCNTTHGEPNMKSSVVITLIVANTTPYPENSIAPHGNTAQEANRNASHPGSPLERVTPSRSTGRSQAAACSSHAQEIRRCGLFRKVIIGLHFNAETPLAPG